jgi:hypothetical protein
MLPELFKLYEPVLFRANFIFIKCETVNYRFNCCNHAANRPLSVVISIINLLKFHFQILKWWLLDIDLSKFFEELNGLASMGVVGYGSSLYM